VHIGVKPLDIGGIFCFYDAALYLQRRLQFAAFNAQLVRQDNDSAHLLELCEIVRIRMHLLRKEMHDVGPHTKFVNGHIGCYSEFRPY
jgi:hypothetical protein